MTGVGIELSQTKVWTAKNYVSRVGWGELVEFDKLSRVSWLSWGEFLGELDELYWLVKLW